MVRDPLYYLSLPERIVRGAAVFLGGLIYETALVLLPTWLRGTRLYRAIVGGLLRIMVEFIGGAKGLLPQEEVTAKELAFRKAAGTGIELVGLLTIGWSPLWLFAVAADITGGTRTYLNALIAELKKSGILPENAEANSTLEILNMFEDTSGIMAETIDIPPLTLREMRQSWDKLFSNARRLPESERLAGIYQEFLQVASQQETTLGYLSSIIAESALKAGIQMGQVHIFDFYRKTLEEIDQEGIKAYSRRVSLPYAVAARSHFDPANITFTQRMLQRKKTGDP